MRQLYAARPRSWLTRASLWAMAALALWAWATLPWGTDSMVVRPGNVRRFFSEIIPYPLQQGQPWTEVMPWAWRLMTEGGGAKAAALTLALSIAGIVLAAVLAALLAPWGARTVARVDPWLEGRGGAWSQRIGWAITRGAVRLLFSLTRAIPEYIWAFWLIALVSQQAWAAVLAMAIHNLGILGRLGSEVIENADPEPAQTLRATGASRASIAALSLCPASLGRWLVFFFYRWETCVRESVVLGLLGLGTLGRLVQNARARLLYDEMFAFVLLGAVLVFAGDLVSARIRRAGRLAGADVA